MIFFLLGIYIVAILMVIRIVFLILNKWKKSWEEDFEKRDN